MKVVRDSKFRHVFGEAQKEKFEDLRISAKMAESTGVRGNSKFIACPWESGGGGSMAVLPLTKTGRQPRDLPLITGHSGPILDFEWNPFNDNMLMTGSEDNSMKLWNIPDEGMKSHMKESLADLKGHSKKINFCTFNPVVDGIVASNSFDMTTRVWNIAEQEELYSIDMPDTAANHMKWNYTGSLIAVTCKDKMLRIIDPRTNTFAATGKVHEGAKPAKCEWIGSTSVTDDTYKIITTGFTTQAERQICIWDIRMFSEEEPEPLTLLSLDPDTGALYPFFDVGTQMLYVAGKGDANVRYFEATNTDPYLHYLDVFSTNSPQKGFDCFPKRCMDVSKHEVFRGIKLESSSITTISFKVPRKSKEFQDDLFPDAPAGRASMTPEEWTGGAEPRGPLLRSMAPGTDSTAQTASASTGIVSVKDLKKQLAEAQAKIQALEKENELLKAENAALKAKQ